MKVKKSISIIGGGPAALFFACFIDTDKFDVSIYEKNKSFGRKFLVAGKGGFNLTHSEDITQMIERYTPTHFLKEALIKFDNQYYQNWLSDIGIPTFVGTSKRIYPEEGIKPIEVLDALLSTLKKKGVHFIFNEKWSNWNKDNDLIFESGLETHSDYVIFALGGASWKVTGSDGQWITNFESKGISAKGFEASNCAFEVDWNKSFIEQNEGAPLKNISVSCQDKKQLGELVITKFGLEGSAIYALSPDIRKELESNDFASVFLDFKPNMEAEKIINKITNSKLKNRSETLRRELNLTSPQVNLLKDFTSKEDFLSPIILTEKIKQLEIKIVGLAPLDEAISTVGGICLEDVDHNFQLNKLENQFCIGEMLDWDAPTGGYLLQASFSMGALLANHLNKNIT